MARHVLLLMLASGAVGLVGAIHASYQIYKMTALDATTRGFKHPKLWGVFAMNGNNSSGLLLYLLGRRNYPVLNLSEGSRLELESRKKKAGIGLIFLAIGGIALSFSIFLM